MLRILGPQKCLTELVWEVHESWSSFLEGPQNVLDLKDVRLDELAVEHLIESWCKFIADFPRRQDRKLQVLNLFECSFADENALEKMIEFIHKIGDELKTLCIEDVGSGTFELGPSDVISLLRGLPLTLESLLFRHADLRGSIIGQAFQEFLQKKQPPMTETRKDSPSLVVLELYHCCMDDLFYEGFISGVRSGAVRLNELNLYSTMVNDERFGMLVDALGAAESMVQKLAVFSRRTMASGSLPALNRLLGNGNVYLKELDLSGCKLFDNVSPNSAVFRTFVQSIESNKSLQKLNVGWCGIKDSQLGCLFQALESNSCLTALDVRIEPICAGTIAKSIPKLKTLMRLKIEMNETERTSPVLIKALYQNTNLVYFHGSECSPKIACILMRNQMLQKLSNFLKVARGGGRRLIEESHWALCAKQMCRNDQTVLYAFIVATFHELVSSWNCQRALMN